MARPEVSTQLTAIAELRWRMFVNGLRSKRGKTELVSRIIVTAAFSLGGFGGFAAATGTSWYVVSQGQPEYLALILWPIFFFWQVFPVMATAFTNNPDSSELLRFPLTYRSFFLIRLAYGYFDPASALGSVAVFGVLLGTTFARPALFPWALLRPFDFRSLQSGLDADRLRLARTLAGAAPHARDHGRTFHSGDAELSVDRPSRRTLRQRPAPGIQPGDSDSPRECRRYCRPASPPMRLPRWRMAVSSAASLPCLFSLR